MKYLLKHCPVNPTLEYADSIKIPKNCIEIVSQGGGATIDCAKWLARKYGLKHTAIPTTAGTGSEVTKYCVLTVDGKKTTFEDEKFIPESYVLDPRLVKSLPKLETISSGLDALSQAMESFWSKNATDESRSYSTIAINLIPKNLVESVKNPNNEVARMNMLVAANMAGRAINITKTNVCHAASYSLTDIYDIPHGIACGLSLAYFSKKILDLNIDLFIKELDLPKYEIDTVKVADIAIKSDKLLDCPIEITKEDIIASLSNMI